MIDAQRPFGLRAEGILKSFRRREILSGASIAVPRGEGAVLQGANGAGKTTLLRILATVVLADEGVAEVAGYDVRRSAARVRERIGVAFVNERSVFWRLNCLENLTLFAATRGVASAERTAQIEGIAAELGITPYLHRRISDLSTGQRQRILLARAALGDPEVLLIDEPLRGLDETGVEQVLRFFRVRVQRGASALIAAPTVSEFAPLDFPLYRIVEGTIQPDSWS